MTSQRKIEANRRNAKKGGRPTRAFDAATDKLAAEILARADAQTVKLAAKKLLERIKAGDAPAAAIPTVSASPTGSAKATDLESLVAELLSYAAVTELAAVQWRQIYLFCKQREDLEGSPRRTQLFRAWQETQELPEEFRDK